MSSIADADSLALGVELGYSTVPRTTGHGVELQILLEGATLARRVGETLLLEVDAHVIEDGDHKHREGEGDPGQAELGSVPSASRGKTEDQS